MEGASDDVATIGLPLGEGLRVGREADGTIDGAKDGKSDGKLIGGNVLPPPSPGTGAKCGAGGRVNHTRGPTITVMTPPLSDCGAYVCPPPEPGIGAYCGAGCCVTQTGGPVAKTPVAWPDVEPGVTGAAKGLDVVWGGETGPSFISLGLCVARGA